MSVFQFGAEELANVVQLILDARIVDRFDALNLCKAYVKANNETFNYTYAARHGAELATDMDGVIDALKKANPDADKRIQEGVSVELLSYNLIANDGKDFGEDFPKAAEFCKVAEKANIIYKRSLR